MGHYYYYYHDETKKGEPIKKTDKNKREKDGEIKLSQPPQMEQRGSN